MVDYHHCTVVIRKKEIQQILYTFRSSIVEH